MAILALSTYGVLNSVTAEDLSKNLASVAQQVQPRVWTGTIERGVTCPRLRLDSGEVYSLMGVASGFLEIGMRVRVTGTTPMISTCQQGAAIKVEQAEEL